MLKWVDKKSVLHTSKRKYRAGNIIPAGVLSNDRAKQLIDMKKVAEIKEEQTIEKKEKPVTEKPIKKEKKVKQKKVEAVPEPVIEQSEVIEDESSDGEDDLFEQA